MLKRQKIVFIILILYGIIAIANNKTFETSEKSIIFNKEYICDSLLVMTYDFYMDEDSNFFSILKKVHFEYNLIIDSNKTITDYKSYHFLIAGKGINKDTIGLISISENEYLYRAKENVEPQKLFDFKAKINDKWTLENNGFFNNYEVELKNVSFDIEIQDSIYTFSFKKNYNFQNQYYLNEYRVSKRLGIISFSVYLEISFNENKTIVCNCL